ncbi:MAG: hypothetical protein A2Y34_16725 [Spirochaetes bacterium GWC1_27_15]|nr:MAG: hypothetical protein A2Z98_12240 [Spirochaetes bacterium GWB1_27_13]OHD20968.1 MAG: hypothetical protein A2Y34_16725 [Spirochaetes bacterium GWC1_27_15]
MKKILILLSLVFVMAFLNAKEKIVIMSLKPASSSEKDIQQATSITENLITAIINNGNYEVLERLQLNKIFEELKLTSGDEFDDQEVLEIGKLAKAKLVLLGSITKLGATISINTRIIDVETSSSRIGKNISVQYESDLPEAIAQLAKDILTNQTTVKFESENTKQFKKYNTLAVSFVISGSISLALGIGLTAVGGYGAYAYSIDYRKYTDSTASTDYKNSIYKEMMNYYSMMIAGLTTGIIFLVAGLALDIVSIPMFVKAKQFKVAMIVNTDNVGLQFVFKY